MYRCSECEYEFEVPQGYHEYYTESIAKWEEGCPDCKSTEYDELKRCSRCGEIVPESELTEGMAPRAKRRSRKR